MSQRKEVKRYEKCKHPSFVVECPGLCNKDKCPCLNNPFPLKISDEEASCKEVAVLSLKKQTKKCSCITIAENCPGLCNKEQCDETPSPVPFFQPSGAPSTSPSDVPSEVPTFCPSSAPSTSQFFLIVTIHPAVESDFYIRIYS
jgi:hypothetical protein